MATVISVPTPSSQKRKKNYKGLDIELGPMDPAIDREARERLITSRVSLLMKNPFFGNLATRMQLKNADDWLTTAATNGRYFYYNSRFVCALQPAEVDFLVGHEVLHLVYDHIGRRDGRDPKIFNIAADYCVNADLIKHRIGTMITTVPCLYDKQFDGWCAEQVYDWLMENATEQDLEDYLNQMLDQHLEGNEDGEGMSAEERQKIRDEIREAVLSAAKTAKDAGDIPANVRQMIQDLTEPKMNWREMLPAEIQSVFRSDYTWMRSSRRSWHMDAILPGSDREKMVDVVIAMDASGSCVGMLKDFLSEVKGIMEQFMAYRVTLLTFDTEVYNPQVYTPENMDSLLEYEIMGGGGTAFDPVYEYLKENDIVPEKLVWLTDGYPCGSWGDDSYCDTLWIIHGSRVTPPYGTWAYLEDA